MIVWDDDDAKVWGPPKEHMCMLCCRPLHAPFIMWHAWRGDTRKKFICSECCNDMRSGLPRDLEQMATARHLRDLGFTPREEICNERLAPMFTIEH
jgi:hypothetical protein